MEDMGDMLRFEDLGYGVYLSPIGTYYTSTDDGDYDGPFDSLEIADKVSAEYRLKEMRSR